MQAFAVVAALGFFSVFSAFAAVDKVFEYSLGRPLDTIPAVDVDGTIYVAGSGAVASLTTNGVQKWKIELSPASQAAIGGITVANDRIYVTSAQGLYALTKTGSQLWTNSLNLAASKVALDGPDNLYVVDNAGILWALRSDGTQRWTNSVEPTIPLNAVADFGPSVGPNGMIFTAAGRVTAFNNAGQKQWDHQTLALTTPPIVNEDGSIYVSVSGTALRIQPNGVVSGDPPFIGIGVVLVAPPVVAPDRTLYVPASGAPQERGLIAFSDAGLRQWRFPDYSISVSPAVAANGTVYIAGDEGVVVALNSAGSPIWKYTNGVPIAKGIAIGTDNSILLAQKNGTLLSLSGSSPLAEHVWPVYGRDPRQTSQQRFIPLTILPVEEIGTNTALFRAELNPVGYPATVYFEYANGQTTAQTPAQQVPATNGMVQVSQSVSGLAAGTLYTARLVNSNVFGISRSTVVSFRTLGEPEEVPPVLGSLVAAATAGGTVKFSGDGVITITEQIEFRTNAVIDANGHRVVLTGNGQSSLLRLGTGVELALNGLWLVNARNSQNLQTYGGAIRKDGGTLRLTNCVLSNNVAHAVQQPQPASRAMAHGGAIFQRGGDLFVQDCLFVSNRVTGDPWSTPTFPPTITYPEGWGGAISAQIGTVQIVNSLFEGNQVPASYPAVGGAIVSDNLSISGSRFIGNSAGLVPTAGAVNATGNLSITNTTFAFNSVWAANPSPRQGWPGDAHAGALFFIGHTGTIQSSSFLTNHAVGGIGGGFDEVPGISWGGGIFNAGVLGVINCTFSGNSARSSRQFSGNVFRVEGQGSAIYSSRSAGVTNSTIAWNTDAYSAVRGHFSTNIILKNTILVATNSVYPTAFDFTDAGHNISSDAPAFTHPASKTNVNVRLGRIGYYGGETLVYPLLPGSPALDAADDSSALATDQRGRTRPFGPHADVGAFEFGPPFFVRGRIRGDLDPTTRLTFGTNTFDIDADGFFSLGPFPAGTNEITTSATNALFLPDPWIIDVIGDTEVPGATSFLPSTIRFYGTIDQPAFVLVGLPGERWRVEMSENLQSWTVVGTYTLDASRLVRIPVPSASGLFLRVTAQN